MNEMAITALTYLVFVAFAAKRLMTYLHVMQQDDYDHKRLWSWIFTNKVFDKRLSLSLIILSILALFLSPFFVGFLSFFAFAFTAYIEKDPRKDSKKKLVMTSRAKRIFTPAFIALALCGLWVFALPDLSPWPWIVLVQSVPAFLTLSNMMLQPIEASVQQRYWNEAQQKVLDLRPKVIGITGSFGKTSVKHILGHILKLHAPTLITPGSVNTPMGIARVIREELDETHKFLVVEMGAYGPGSIAGICKLTPPDMAIITAIGHAHYERFRTLDTVCEAKYELAEAALKKEDGRVIVHERTLNFDYAAQMRKKNDKRFVVAGSAKQQGAHLKPDDLHIEVLQQRPQGLELMLKWQGESYYIETPLFGSHHGHNIALAFAAAIELGIEPEHIITALKSLPQITHRLEVKPQADGTTIIDDAFNSNPVGFRAALDLLPMINTNGGRNILITPGMVELGSSHDSAHEKLGLYAGQVCDVALIVTPERIPTFIRGFKQSGIGKELIEVKSFADASRWIQANKRSGDLILIENDLPDMYERIPQI